MVDKSPSAPKNALNKHLNHIVDLMHYCATHTVRFADCDPAGIVFFPQYLVMLNTLHERWFTEALGVPYHLLLGPRRTGMPTVRLEVDFTAVSRHGDVLRQELSISKLGRSSVALRVNYFGGDELRLRAHQVLVCTDLNTHRPLPLPDDIRQAMLAYVESDAR
jgi:4-hydroxybenzoyl-CoA thioesterase